MLPPKPLTHRGKVSGWPFVLLLFVAHAAVAAGPAVASPPADLQAWSVEKLAAPVPASSAGGDVATLVLDDGTREADIGFGDNAASQFLWFNVFDEASGSGAVLEEIQVLFPPSAVYAAGDAVELVVYRDTDQDPTNGAELVLAFEDVIEVADGISFSSYAIDPPITIEGGGDILLGVVNRFVESGVSPPSRPAALDTSASQGRSYFALWSGDPPPSPTLPSDLLIATVDTVEAGNWMIRGVTSDLPTTDIPALGGIGLALLALLLAACGALVLRSTR